MKYKCLNCGQIYSVKTAYCDCGNNTFEEILEDFDLQNQNNNTIDVLYNKKDDDEDYQPAEKEEKNYADILSVILLIFAIIVSCILLYKAFSKKSVKNIEDAEIVLECPDVDTYWDNTVNPDNKNAKSSDEVIVIKTQQKPQEKPKENNVQNNAIPKNNNAEKAKTAKQNSDVKKRQAQQKAQQKANDLKQKEKAEQQRKIAEEKKKEELAKKEKERLEKERIEKEKQEQEKLAKELNSYKITIRKTLFNNFPILNVSGVGSAKVGFSISQDGKLLNRRFVSQSDNKSLNDAMYNMLMRTPYVEQPPKGYKGGEIILKMDYNNGSYSFSYVN